MPMEDKEACEAEQLCVYNVHMLKEGSRWRQFSALNFTGPCLHLSIQPADGGCLFGADTV